MFVPFIGLFVTLTFLGARFTVPGMKELTDRREPLFMRISSAVCIASEANIILDIAQVATWVYKTATLPKDLLPYNWDNLWCPISRADLITERGLLVINNTETSLIDLYPICYEEDKPSWWNDVHVDRNTDDNASTILPSFKEFLDIVIAISCISLHSWTRITSWGRSAKGSRPGAPSDVSDGSDEGTPTSIQIHPKVEKAISRNQRSRTFHVQPSDFTIAAKDPKVSLVSADNNFAQPTPEARYILERQWALDLYRPQNRAPALIIRALVASPAAHTTQPGRSRQSRPYQLEQDQLEKPNKKRKKNRPSQGKRERWSQKRQRMREPREGDGGDPEERRQEMEEEHPALADTDEQPEASISD
ncbi:hypothetical protein BDV32DRAFT_154893 [Aspergillus pseudonomiae]|uniref:Uncharacterized protein n=1 Tax=Aspergillus pseudonomiae TaxID=1506151 RepID=A0A5N7CZZ8_9EURO|nr:uncharacterized protein BDV37DRAFT_225539 [Aspergillus pseudonomiae]KAB8254774.1 hypothetical protein BDV32DRAFT_154893 [Aspergillus pseudonomiae]KAE8399742.1 hypothetical protein BDV37DRAFT_225539 [Aspergillus pseudonomiae]